MKAYLDLMRKILEEGNPRDDRTGTGTIGLFAAEMRFDLREGFPLVTTKKCHLRSIIHELLWFMSGDTNTKYLTDNGVTIWDEWAVPEDTRVKVGTKNFMDCIDWLMATGCFKDRASAAAYASDLAKQGLDTGLSSSEVIAHGINSSVMFNNHKFDPYVYDEYPAGSLGPVYGRLLRAYPTVSAHGTVMDFDQMADTMRGLRERPFSRRHVINLWHPGLLPDESISPQDNVVEGRQALAPCHYSIQFYVQRHPYSDAVKYLTSRSSDERIKALCENNPVGTIEAAKALGWREYGLSLKFTQRSIDTCVGLPFNIASYSCMLMAYANDLGMEPREVIFSGGDVHIYSNHLEGAREQITREPRPLPKMRLLCPEGTPFDKVKFEDFELTEYDPHPHIKFPIAK